MKKEQQRILFIFRITVIMIICLASFNDQSYSLTIHPQKELKKKQIRLHMRLPLN